MWRCPVCGGALKSFGRQWRCEQNHCYDCAKEGYVHLLLANQKHSKEPGDGAEMISARRAIMDAGYFQPLARALAELVAPAVAQLEQRGTAPLHFLDLGCGEGYYLGQLQQAFPGAVFQGVDIAKHAVKRAAKRYKDIDFAVASSFRLPLCDQSVDVLSRIFAPSDDVEAGRVLSPQGVYVVVTPGERHLRQVREVLYRDVRPYRGPRVPEGFSLEEQRFCHYVLERPSSTAALIAMTPFQWHGDHRHSSLPESLPAVDMDFVLSLYRLAS